MRFLLLIGGVSYKRPLYIIHTIKFSEFSILEMAANGRCQKFLSHPGVWNKIMELWKLKRGCFWSAYRLFFINWILNAIFVATFALFYISHLCNTIQTIEWLLLLWVVGYLVEEVRQALDASKYSIPYTPPTFFACFFEILFLTFCISNLRI